MAGHKETYIDSIEETSYIPENTISSLLQDMIENPDQFFRGFVALQIINHIKQRGVDFSKITSISKEQNNLINIQGENINGDGIALFIDPSVYVQAIQEGENIDQNLAIEEINYDEATARYQESISQFQQSLVHLEVLSNAIQRALIKNDNDTWEVIDENDRITEGVFEGMTLVEAIFVYRKRIIDSGQDLRNLGYISPEYEEVLSQAKQELFDANEEYLFLSFGIGEIREELVHVMPKTQGESLQLIKSVVARRDPEEILAWMRDTHNQIDANNWQSGSVEGNYRYFTETLNREALEALRIDIFDNESSPHYRNPQLLLDFAVLISGRPAWNEESGLLGYDWGRYPSPVDSRLWMPDIASEALALAMDVKNENEDKEHYSMMDEMMPYLEISDPLLENANPNRLVQDIISLIGENVSSQDDQGEIIALGETQEFSQQLESWGYHDIFQKASNGELANDYSKLDLKEMTELSGLLRIKKSLGEYDNMGPGHSRRFLGYKDISLTDFEGIVQTSAQEAVEHVGAELDKNFDDSFWERAAERMVPFADRLLYESEEQRAAQFGIEVDSLEYQIFTLYNDINGNGNSGEVSDNTRSGMKTAGYMMAMVAGSMILGGGIGLAISTTRGVALSIGAQGALMGASGSAVGYGLDSIVGDAVGFYTPSEAIIGLSTDFALGAGTGYLSGPVAQMLPGVPTPAIFAGDLTLLGLGPEIVRQSLVQKTWHGSEIWTEENERGPIAGRIIQLRREYIGDIASEEEIESYLHNSDFTSILTRGEEYSYFQNIFQSFGVRSNPKITPEFDIRFQEACAIYEILNPGQSHYSIYHSAGEFSDFKNLDFSDLSTKELHDGLINATTSWIENQESRLNSITPQL